MVDAYTLPKIEELVKKKQNTKSMVLNIWNPPTKYPKKTKCILHSKQMATYNNSAGHRKE